MTWLVALLVGVLVVAAFVAFAAPSAREELTRLAAAVCAGVLAVLAFVTVLTGGLTGPGDLLGRVLVVELFLAAVVAGSPVTATVLWLVDRDSVRGGDHAIREAGTVLRGGVWIGVFERAAVFAALASGWPEGLAVVLALKGLGRYSELRGAPATSGSPAPVAHGGVAERFLIGSFASLLWACACAGIYLTLAS
jgi:hypothetical protein